MTISEAVGIVADYTDLARGGVTHKPDRGFAAIAARHIAGYMNCTRLLKPVPEDVKAAVRMLIGGSQDREGEHDAA